MNRKNHNSPTHRISVAAALIVRNDKRTIERCLTALSSAVDQIIVVDTGSTDGTDSVVRNMGFEVHKFQWIDDFAAARSFALSLVKMDWVISIDADEILYAEDTESVRAVASLYNETPGAFALQILQMNIIGETISPRTETRMFPTNRGIVWTRPIHEQVVAQNQQTIPVYPVQLRVFHDGYDPAKVDTREKYLRNVRILTKHVQLFPSDAVSHGFLGREHLMLGNVENALHNLRVAEELLTKSKGSNPMALAEIKRNLVLAYEKKGKLDQAEELSLQLTHDFPNYVDGWYLYGFYQMMKAGKVQSATKYFNKSLELSAQGNYSSDPTIGSFRGLLHLADVYRLTGNWLEARRLYKEVLRRMPHFKEVNEIITQIDKQVLRLAEEIRGK